MGGKGRHRGACPAPPPPLQAALGLLVARSAMGGSSEPQDGSAPSTMLGRLGEMLRTGW